jgi:proline iminopeptidase
MRLETILILVVMVLLLPVALAALWRTWLQQRTRNARDKIDPEIGVDEFFTANIGGLEQWFHVRDIRRESPLLLWLHGGPGTPMMPFQASFQPLLEDQFTVVHWDQRGVGKSFNQNPRFDYASTTYDRLIQDAIEVVAFLKQRYGKEQIIVLGHSWGSMLALPLLQACPESICAYVGTGQVVNIDPSETIGYQMTLRTAREKNHTVAIKELEGIAPYPDSTGSMENPKSDVLRRWQHMLGIGISKRYAGILERQTIMTALASPEYSLRDVLTLGKRDMWQAWPILMRELNTYDAAFFGQDFAMPMFLFSGRHDWQTPSTLASVWFQTVRAPYRQEIWFEESAHSVMIDQPELFARMLKNLVLPLVNSETTNSMTGSGIPFTKGSA